MNDINKIDQNPAPPPEIQATIERIKELNKNHPAIIAASEKLKLDALSTKTGRGIQPAFGFLPTDLGRVAPFFPLNRREMNQREYLKELPLGNPSWGELLYSGPKLSTHDEDVLLAVTELIKKHKALTIKTSIYEICNILGIKPQQNSYKSIWSALENLTKGTLKLTVRGKSQGISNMLNTAVRDEKTNAVIIEVNTFFLNTYLEGLISTIDIGFRRSLKGSIAKELYRFLRCHPGCQHEFHFHTIARAINMNLDREARKIKADLKSAFTELKTKGYLEKFILKGDTFLIYKKNGKKKTLKP